MKTLKRFAFVMFVFIFASSVTVNAATNNPPYGFTFDNTAVGTTVYRYYEYSSTKDVYVPKKEFYSRNTKLYNQKGVFVTDTYGSSAQFNGFDKNGNFYIITPKLALIKVDIKTSKKSKLIKSGCIRLAYNLDDIAVSVVTNSGWISLSTLKPTAATETETDDAAPTPTPAPKKNRIEAYTNSANEIVYEAYKNNKTKLKLVISSDGQKVLNVTNSVRLSDSLKGAKFTGIDTSYNVYLYEGSTLYRFRYGSWHSAQKIKLSGNYKSFKNDKNGFISKIVTSSSSYTISQLTTSDKWKATKTYAVRKADYTTFYVKGSSNSYTLLYKNNKLCFNGKQIAEAENVKFYGFTASKRIVYLKGNILYAARLKTPTKATAIVKNVQSVVVSSSTGLVVTVKQKDGTTVNVK